MISHSDIQKVCPSKWGLLVVLLFSYCSAAGQAKKTKATLNLLSGKNLNGEILYGDWEKTPGSISFFPIETKGKQVIPIDSIDRIEIPGYPSFWVRQVTYDQSPNDLNLLEEGVYKYDTLVAKRLLRVIIEAPISLLEYTGKNGRQYFFIETPEKELHTLEYKKYLEHGSLKEKNRFRNLLSLLLNDCRSLEPKITTCRYTEASLKALIEQYLTCTKMKKKPSTVTRRPPTFHLSAGPHFSKIDFKGSYRALDTAPFEHNANATAFASVEFKTLRRFNRHRVATETGLKKYSCRAQTTVISYSITGNVKESFDFNFRFLYWKSSAVYRFVMYDHSAFKLFTDIGYSLNVLVHQSTKYKKNNEDYPSLFEARRMDPNYIFGLGSYFNRYSLLFRYEKIHGLSPFIGTSGLIRSFSIAGGYRLF